MANKKKIVFSVDRDTKEIECMVGSKTYGFDMSKDDESRVETIIRWFLTKNTKMTDYEEDCMWMSYRYCIGRKSIASQMHAGDIWLNCRDRMSHERQLFAAYDINSMIENQLTFTKPYFYFPRTCESRITYGTAVDAFCEFMLENDIKSVEELLRYRSVNVILTDNERGYKLEPTTWTEWIAAHLPEGASMETYEVWKNDNSSVDKEQANKFKELTRDMPNPDHYYMHDLESLFVWNDLCHCFNTECHHKSVLTDGSECEWFWSWANNTEPHEDGNHYLAFGYHKIRVPVDKWNGNVTTYIPDKSVIRDLY